MDYSKLLYAFHVRELAAARLVHQTPSHMTENEAADFRRFKFEQTVKDVNREIINVAQIIEGMSGSH
jgi:hypothetical protein